METKQEVHAFSGAVQSKLHKASTSIFAVMSAEAEKHNAINLSQGFPGFPVSEELISLCHKYMKQGLNQYAPMPGVLKLREMISEKMKRAYSLYYNPSDEITITAGATQALFTAISAFVKAGDEVLLFDPAYDSYAPAIEMCGGVAIHINLNESDFSIPWAEVKNRVNHKTRMIIINTPHNPSGSVLSASDLLQLEKICSQSDIIVLSDEVYEHIVFDGYEHQSVARYLALASRSILIYSFGKTFHATGWKLGYAVGPKNLMQEFRKVHQYLVFAVNTPLQHAMAEYMQCESNYTEVHKMYESKRNYFSSLLKSSRFKLLPCSGSYFLLLDYSNISKNKDTEFALHLTREHKVASIPVSVFYKNAPDQYLLRFCFAKEEHELEEAAKRLCAI